MGILKPNNLIVNYYFIKLRYLGNGIKQV